MAALTAGCPAAKSGQIRAGDILLSVDGTLLKALALDGFFSRIIPSLADCGMTKQM